MAKLTWGNIRDRIEAKVWDASNAIWTTAVIDAVMTDLLPKFSAYRPTIDREILATVEDSYMLDISAIPDLLFIDRLEYEVDQDPPDYRNWDELYDGMIRMDLNIAPDADDEDVYLYVAKPQRITNSDNVTDLVGAIDLGAGYEEGDETIHVDGLQATGTIPAGTHFKITGDSTPYYLTAAATIASNEGDFAIAPPLQADVADGAVVTLETSSLNPLEEQWFIEYVAGTLARDYSFEIINSINNGGVAVPEKVQSWGTSYLAEVIANLQANRYRRDTRRYPRS